MKDDSLTDSYLPSESVGRIKSLVASSMRQTYKQSSGRPNAHAYRRVPSSLKAAWVNVCSSGTGRVLKFQTSLLCVRASIVVVIDEIYPRQVDIADLLSSHKCDRTMLRDCDCNERG